MVKPWLVWLSGLGAGLRSKRLPVQFPVRARAWVVGQVPSWGCTRGNRSISYTLMFLPLAFSLPSPLSKNQIFKNQFKMVKSMLWTFFYNKKNKGKLQLKKGSLLREAFWVIQCKEAPSPPRLLGYSRFHYLTGFLHSALHNLKLLGSFPCKLREDRDLVWSVPIDTVQLRCLARSRSLSIICGRKH